MAITFGSPLMVFPSSWFDGPEEGPDHDPFEDIDPFDLDGVFPYMDEDGTQVIDPRDERDADYIAYLDETAGERVAPTTDDGDDEDWVLNLRGGWA